jgi:hypothetical protein
MVLDNHNEDKGVEGREEAGRRIREENDASD